MTHINASAARDEFPELITRAGYSGERIVIERRSKPIAAIISYADLERLEAMEDAIDSALLRQAISENNGAFLTPEEVIEVYNATHGTNISVGKIDA